MGKRCCVSYFRKQIKLLAFDKKKEYFTENIVQKNAETYSRSNSTHILTPSKSKYRIHFRHYITFIPGRYHTYSKTPASSCVYGGWLRLYIASANFINSKATQTVHKTYKTTTSNRQGQITYLCWICVKLRVLCLK